VNETISKTKLNSSSTIDRSSETTEAGIAFSKFAGFREKNRDRFVDHFRLPIVRGHLQLAFELEKEPSSVLDVGATDRRWKNVLEERWRDVQYRSCDLDRSSFQDYYDWDDINREFDLILCVEVLEHLSPDLGLALAELMAKRCASGGYVLVTVPNVYTPGYQLEFTHRTALGPFDLGGLLESAGLEVVSIARVAPASTGFHDLVHRTAIGWLHRLLRVDYCQSVAVIARKPAMTI
jgi:SAM-dependent methyltransferase